MKQQTEIIDAAAKHLGITPADIDMDASLSEDMGLSPIEVADLLTVLAQQFNISFDPAEVDDIKTIGDIVDMVEDLLLE